jgi:hypothetical protein
MKKLLRRRCLIREYDYKRLSVTSLYHRCTFEPITRNSLEHENLVRVLRQGTANDWQNPYESFDQPRNILWKMKDWLYNERYLKYSTVSYNEQGEIWIRYNQSKPSSRLGWAVFEYDYEIKHGEE